MNALDTPNKSLFLSYSRKQTDWCNELYTAIDTYTHYYRWRDNKIAESSDWWDSICLNIEGCFAFVALLSPDYLNSVYCMGELEYALKLNKPVIALVLQESDYPAQLDALRLQFARVNGLDISNVINRVLSACNQITLDYVQGKYSTDIHPRAHLRPRVPVPPSNAPAPEEDAMLNKQVGEVSVHGQIPTREMVRRFNEEKKGNLLLARDLLGKIAQRRDIPSFFDVEEEDADLRVVETTAAEAERQRQRLKQIREEYDELEHYLQTTESIEARRKALKRFTSAYPDFGDPKGFGKRFIPILPAPFAWMPIPAGKVTLSTQKTFEVPAFEIAKYPVTNAQFAEFIKAGGYTTQRWWTPNGWQKRIEGWHYDGGWKASGKPWTEPRYWGDAKWNGANHPVVGVSWYEAVAFCVWMSEATGDNIMLPTEQQWQRAAQARPDGGDSGWAYVWGNDWKQGVCNNSVKPEDSSQTTPVTHFESAGNVSLCGVVDLIGNVWEWCLTEYESGVQDVNGTNVRVLRGGSWSNGNSHSFRADFRFNYYPHDWSWLLLRGFRLSRS